MPDPRRAHQGQTARCVSRNRPTHEARRQLIEKALRSHHELGARDENTCISFRIDDVCLPVRRSRLRWRHLRHLLHGYRPHIVDQLDDRGHPGLGQVGQWRLDRHYRLQYFTNDRRHDHQPLAHAAGFGAARSDGPARGVRPVAAPTSTPSFSWTNGTNPEAGGMPVSTSVSETDQSRAVQLSPGVGACRSRWRPVRLRRN